MTAQEIFDTVVRALREQGMPSMDENECRYRTEGDNGNTLKCAVGHLIPDDVYSRGLEGYTVNSEEFQPTLDRLGLTEHMALLRDLQYAHDDAALFWKTPFIDTFLANAREVAARFGLDPSATDLSGMKGRRNKELPVGKPQVDDGVFVSLINLVMRADPLPISQWEEGTIKAFLDSEARVRGFEDWSHAWIHSTREGTLISPGSDDPSAPAQTP